MPTALVGLVVLVVIVAGGLALRVGGTVGDGSAPSPADFSQGGSMTASDIAYFAKMAGFLGQDLSTAIAIALAESSGNPVAYNPETAAKTPDGMGSYGLWQIYKKAHPEYNNVDLFDPQLNANAAYAIYLAKGGFSPWSTYKNNAYQAHLDVANSAALSA